MNSLFDALRLEHGKRCATETILIISIRNFRHNERNVNFYARNHCYLVEYKKASGRQLTDAYGITIHFVGASYIASGWSSLDSRTVVEMRGASQK
jgi:hypothetical protein